MAFALGYLFFPIPSPGDVVTNQVATVSYRDGSDLAQIVPARGNRTKVGIDQIPEPVRYAVLAAEDRSFYSNPGFDLTGIARAAWNQVRGGSGGGSTITQQYVKNTLVGNERSLWRKYEEMVVAAKISQQRSKDEVLADYLNAIYFGRGAYGIQSAAQAYFGTNVEDLTPSQGALLAGVIQSPSRWDPAASPERAFERWNFVLDGMVSQGWLTPQQRSAAQFPPTLPRQPMSDASPADSRGLILDAVKDELAQLGISEQEITQEGLRITTTIDPAKQRQAVDAAHRELAGQPVNLRGALVSVDPGSGAIVAYYGGDNGVGLDYARVHRQAGSTFKPFVVLAALQHDPPIGLGTTFSGAPLPGVRNAEGAQCDVCDLKQAMTVSNNVVFRSLALKIGPQSVADAAHQAGISSALTDPDEGIALGDKEVTPVELASAYATLAAGGVYYAPHLVSKVVTSDDHVLYEANPVGEERMPAKVARNVTEAMVDVAGNEGLQLSDGRQVAAKTGTVQSRFADQNKDAWIAGYTPSLATAVWLGTDQNSPIRTAAGTPITGAGLTGSIWRTFMNHALDEAPEQSFPTFEPIGRPPPEASDPPTDTPLESASPSAEVGPGPTVETPAGAPGEQAVAPVPAGAPAGAPPGAPAGTAGHPSGTARPRSTSPPAAPPPAASPPAPGPPAATPPSRSCGLLSCR